MPDKSPSKRIARCIVLVGEILTDSEEGGASFHLSRWPHSDTDVNAKCYPELNYRCNFLIGINKAEIVVVTHLFELLLMCLLICKMITPIKTYSDSCVETDSKITLSYLCFCLLTSNGWVACKVSKQLTQPQNN